MVHTPDDELPRQDWTEIEDKPDPTAGLERLRDQAWGVVDNLHGQYPDDGWDMLDAEDLDANLATLVTVHQQREFCRGCAGLDWCKQVAKSPVRPFLPRHYVVRYITLVPREDGTLRVDLTWGHCSERKERERAIRAMKQARWEQQRDAMKQKRAESPY